MDIKQEFYRKDIERNSDIRSLENMLSGLFDGYLYDKIQILALKLPTDLATRIMKVYFTCSKYPKSETQVY
jgi:hypothetical protein